MQMKKGFTLIELLVVIAIVAVLATAVVVILNPAQLVRQGRDANRISDLAAIHSALALYLSERRCFDFERRDGHRMGEYRFLDRNFFRLAVVSASNRPDERSDVPLLLQERDRDADLRA